MWPIAGAEVLGVRWTVEPTVILGVLTWRRLNEELLKCRQNAICWWWMMITVWNRFGDGSRDNSLRDKSGMICFNQSARLNQYSEQWKLRLFLLPSRISIVVEGWVVALFGGQPEFAGLCPSCDYRSAGTCSGVRVEDQPTRWRASWWRFQALVIGNLAELEKAQGGACSIATRKLLKQLIDRWQQ